MQSAFDEIHSFCQRVCEKWRLMIGGTERALVLTKMMTNDVVVYALLVMRMSWCARRMLDMICAVTEFVE